MKLGKNGIRGLGLLTLVAIFVIVGFFIAKPQIEEAFELSDETSLINERTSMREIRLATLQSESGNLEELSAEVDNLLVAIPSEKNVTEIAGAIVDAMPPGVQLISFSHGELILDAPAYTPPTASISGNEIPFELQESQTSSSADETEETETSGDSAEGIPSLAVAPFILEVEASRMESLSNFLDLMQTQDRLIHIVAVDAGYNSGVVRATIYGYAFAGSTPQIIAWENPVEDTTNEEEATE